MAEGAKYKIWKGIVDFCLFESYLIPIAGLKIK